MAKKPKNTRPPLLSFLLREFKSRQDSAEDKREQKEKDADAVNPWFIPDPRAENITSRLLSALLRDYRKRPDPEEEKAQNETDDETDAEAERPGDEDEDIEDGLIPEESDALLKGRFEVLPSNPLGEDYIKRAGETARTLKGPRIKSLEETAAQVRRTADNYRQMYMDQRAREEAMTAGKEKEIEDKKKSEAEAARKAAQEQKVASAYRYRARELQNQIAWWRQQQGAGQYDDVTVNATIDNLQRELSGIPQGYW